MTETTHRLVLKDLNNTRATKFSVVPSADTLKEIRDRLGIDDLRKLRFEGELRPDGTQDWVLEGHLGVTVVQACVVTGDPVTTRLEEDVTRHFLANPPELPHGDEIEMPEDDTIEDLPETLDLLDIVYEVTAIALPPYPRSEGAELEQRLFSPPGAEPLTDAAASPFAGLAALKDQFSKDED